MAPQGAFPLQMEYRLAVADQQTRVARDLAGVTDATPAATRGPEAIPAPLRARRVVTLPSREMGVAAAATSRATSR